MGVFNYSVGMYIEECIVCGISFAIPIDYMQERSKDHKSFCCPNGHKQYYPQQSEEERLKKKLERTEDCLETCQIDNRILDYRARYYKGKITKIQKGTQNPA